MNVGESLKKYRRVLQIARKPSRDEFIASSKISALGMGIVGLIGFAIFMVFVFLGI